jgi:hypothetical protein
VFMAREAPELQEALAGALSADRDIEQCAAFFAERLEELTRPGEVFSSLEGDVGECCACLENLSLDLQTGKNAQAAKTVERFSLLSEKIFRLLKLPELKEFIPETVNGEKFSAFFEGFGGILQEILGAWQNQDTVLLGDLAEYEVAPRLRAFYEAVKDNLDQN